MVGSDNKVNALNILQLIDKVSEFGQNVISQHDFYQNEHDILCLCAITSNWSDMMDYDNTFFIIDGDSLKSYEELIRFRSNFPHGNYIIVQSEFALLSMMDENIIHIKNDSDIDRFLPGLQNATWDDDRIKMSNSSRFSVVKHHTIAFVTPSFTVRASEGDDTQIYSHRYIHNSKHVRIFTPKRKRSSRLWSSWQYVGTTKPNGFILNDISLSEAVARKWEQKLQRLQLEYQQVLYNQYLAAFDTEMLEKLKFN